MSMELCSFCFFLTLLELWVRQRDKSWNKISTKTEKLLCNVHITHFFLFFKLDIEKEEKYKHNICIKQPSLLRILLFYSSKKQVCTYFMIVYIVIWTHHITHFYMLRGLIYIHAKYNFVYNTLENMDIVQLPADMRKRKVKDFLLLTQTRTESL